MHTTEEVLFSVEKHVGVITLNRPHALNALNYAMFKALLEQLTVWKHDTAIHAVMIQAVEGRAFCAGGDVRWVYDVGQNAPLEALDLFHHEYRLNYLISDLGKPYVAFMDGITIGGGVGVTLHGSHRVASERFAFVMPEASIGLFPDIGSSHLLSACPNGYGLYLGLTGQRVNAEDSKNLKFLDYTVLSESFEPLKKALIALDLSENAHAKIAELITSYQTAMPSGDYAADKQAVARCYEVATSLNAIFDALKLDNSEWARSKHAILLQNSPLSLHVTVEQLRRAKGLNLATCLSMDYGLTYHFLHGHDFYEGVRARLVDKDKSPHWKPDAWEEVSLDEVMRYFDSPVDIPPLW